MLLALLLGGYYSLYVALLHGAIRVAMLFSLLVSADRVLNVAKYLFIKARARLTGHLPQHNWNFKPLPADPHAFPKVSHGAAGPSWSPTTFSTPQAEHKWLP